MEAMLNYATIVQEKRSGKGAIGHTEAKQYLRHKHPMLGVDRIVDHDFEQGWVHAVRAVSCSHPAFEGHFEDAAIYPGTTLCQDTIQLCILLFIGSSGALTGEGDNREMTAVSSLNSNMGHPVPPGSVLDIAVWKTGGRERRAMTFGFEARMRDFAHYTTPNSLGLTFRAALQGSAELVRVRRKIYRGIGF
jgi:3-hydroxymyristoyl/3-hydroxydecanoyl-(acyl carrier protein) dehydratase